MAWADANWLRNKIVGKLVDINNGLINKLSTTETNIKNNSNSNRETIKSAISNTQTAIINNNNSNKDIIKSDIINNGNENRDKIKNDISSLDTKVSTISNTLDVIDTNIKTVKNNMSSSTSTCINASGMRLKWISWEYNHYTNLYCIQGEFNENIGAMRDSNGKRYVPYMVEFTFDAYKDSVCDEVHEILLMNQVNKYFVGAPSSADDFFNTHYFRSTASSKLKGYTSMGTIAYYDIYGVDGSWLYHDSISFHLSQV